MRAAWRNRKGGRALLAARSFFPAQLLAPPSLASGLLPLPTRQQFLRTLADVVLVGEKGALVGAVQVGEDLLGIYGCGELGAAAALPLGRCHHGFANAGTAHGLAIAR